jgi:acetyl-CoA carboxylase carboxyl transferase subunit beta
MTALERLAALLDADSFHELDAGMTSVDTLKFTGMASYSERLRSYQKKTGLKDAVITGLGTIDGRPVAIAVMDFNFIAATMGSVVGEKLARLIERGTAERRPVIIVSASGGARMYEGVLSLVQMAKTCGALALHAQARLPYISVMTQSDNGRRQRELRHRRRHQYRRTKSDDRFAGPRVIKETTHQDLPPGFQTAEFLEEHGLVDLIVHRKKMREMLRNLLEYLLPLR